MAESGSEKSRKKKRQVLVVTAHPDDECMFFGPTICSMVAARHTEVHLLCMSTGNYYQCGDERREELRKSCSILGIAESNLYIVDHKDLQDGGDNCWECNLIADIVNKHVQEYDINWVVTFDDYGISGHPNHKALYSGVECLMQRESTDRNRLEAYSLTSTNIIRKYSSFLDVAYSSAVACMSSDTFFISSWGDIFKAQRAMYAHTSQFVWFRILYILFSRYMIVNTLEPICPLLDSY